jgi:hypothetical protein
VPTPVHLGRAWQEAKPTDCTLPGFGIKGSLELLAQDRLRNDLRDLVGWIPVDGTR